MCDTGYRVENHTCVQCDRGKYNNENYDASGHDRDCTEADVNHYVDSIGRLNKHNVKQVNIKIKEVNLHVMLYYAMKMNVSGNQSCLSTRDLHNDPGDDASSGTNTRCDAILCSENYRVSNHTCVICDQGTYNPPGDDASGPDTYCQQVLCDENEYISNHTCQACPPRSYNSPGDYHDEYIYSEINGGFYSCQDDIIQFCNTEILNDMIQTQTGINTLSEGKRRGEELCDSEPSCTGFQLYCGSQSCNDQSVVDIYFFKDNGRPIVCFLNKLINLT